jgi:hypothetical protein
MREKMPETHHLPFLLRALRTVVATAPLALTAQAPAPDQGPDLATLASRVGTAHRPSGPVDDVTQFRCSLQLHLLDPRAEQKGLVDLSVQFMLWQREGRKKIRPLIRYEFSESEQPIVRGCDENGPWQLVRGEPRDLTGAELVQDLENFTKHTNLARQLIRFLAPDDVLRSLAQPTDVTETEILTNSRQPPVACWTVAGTLDSFPLLQHAGEDSPVHLRVYVDRATARLVAADACPLIGGEPDESRSERILLGDQHERDGVLVPRRLTHLFRDAEGNLRPHSTAALTTLILRPSLTVVDFKRH